MGFTNSPLAPRPPRPPPPQCPRRSHPCSFPVNLPSQHPGTFTLFFSTHSSPHLRRDPAHSLLLSAWCWTGPQIGTQIISLVLVHQFLSHYHQYFHTIILSYNFGILKDLNHINRVIEPSPRKSGYHKIFSTRKFFKSWRMLRFFIQSLSYSFTWEIILPPRRRFVF